MNYFEESHSIEELLFLVLDISMYDDCLGMKEEGLISSWRTTPAILALRF
jgi:hypothetical protein